MGRPGEESETLVHERLKNGLESRVPRDTRNPVGSRVDHHPRQNTTGRPIEESTVRERRKEPRERSEIEPETVCPQAVEALYMRDGVPIEE